MIVHIAIGLGLLLSARSLFAAEASLCIEAAEADRRLQLSLEAREEISLQHCQLRVDQARICPERDHRNILSLAKFQHLDRLSKRGIQFEKTSIHCKSLPNRSCDFSPVKLMDVYEADSRRVVVLSPFINWQQKMLHDADDRNTDHNYLTLRRLFMLSRSIPTLVMDYIPSLKSSVLMKKVISYFCGAAPAQDIRALENEIPLD